jgi:hypothetical protein
MPEKAAQTMLGQDLPFGPAVKGNAYRAQGAAKIMEKDGGVE